MKKKEKESKKVSNVFKSNINRLDIYYRKLKFFLDEIKINSERIIKKK